MFKEKHYLCTNLFKKENIMNGNHSDIDALWEKAKEVEGYEPNMYRKDACGAWIMKDKYGDTNNAYGWEIDYIYPKSLGGNDNSNNLRPLQWENNKSKGNDYPNYKAAVTADGVRNINKTQMFTVHIDTQSIISKLYKIQ